jgi:hypothetical protein
VSEGSILHQHFYLMANDYQSIMVLWFADLKQRVQRVRALQSTNNSWAFRTSLMADIGDD